MMPIALSIHTNGSGIGTPKRMSADNPPVGVDGSGFFAMCSRASKRGGMLSFSKEVSLGLW